MYMLLKFIPSLHAFSELQFVPYFLNIPCMYLDILSILSVISFKFVSKHFEGMNVLYICSRVQKFPT